MRKFGYLDPETYENVRHVGFFLGGANRAGAQAGWVDTTQAMLSDGCSSSFHRGTGG